MRHILRITATLLGLYCAALAYAQQPQPIAAVPRLVRFNGSFRPADGTPTQTMESVTLSVYRDPTGGDALWHEIQNVVVEADGHYSLLMGATKNEGMPVDLFASGEPRWLGVQFNRPGEAEQPRTLLVSVPYALKAADAETLGGKPASAYLLAAPEVGTDTAHTSSTAVVKTKATPTNSGQPNFIGKFVNTIDLVDSALYEVNGNVGIFTTSPAISLDVRTGTLPQMGIAGKTDYLTFFASDQFGPAIYWDPAKDMRFGKGGSGLYNPFGFVEYMRIQSSTGNVGIGTQTPGSKLDVAGNINFTGSVQYQGNTVLQLPPGTGGINIALGFQALTQNTTGIDNTSIGNVSLASNTTGSFNTANGSVAMEFNTTGSNNTGTGYGALSANTTGNHNTANGSVAMQSNTIGTDNTGIGFAALLANTTGNRNTANGSLAMEFSNGGSDNTATGYSAMAGNNSGTQNTASGSQALEFNKTGSQNVAIGAEALNSNDSGSANTAVGARALQSNVSGVNNLAIGFGAAINVAAPNSNNIHIGTPGVASDNATVRIGNSALQTKFFVAGVRGITTGNNDAIAVVIDSNGQLGTKSSSRRFKEDIQNMGAASQDLMRLRPVTYRYKQPFADGSKPIQYGLVAEEVAEVYPDLVAHSADGQIETVKYDVLDSLLLNEMQRLERENRDLRERLAKIETMLASQGKQDR